MDCRTGKCGCNDKGLTTPCPTTIACADAQPCAEMFSERCILNANEEMIYGDLVLEKGESLYTSLQKLMILANSGDPSVAPINFRVVSITSTSAVLEWELQTTTPLVLSYGTTTAMATTDTLTDGTVSVSLSSALTPDTYYYFKISANGEDSVTLKVKTLTT